MTQTEASARAGPIAQDSASMTAEPERVPWSGIAFVHAVNLILLCLLLIGSAIGYYHVPAPSPETNERFGMRLWLLGSIPYWLQPVLYILLFAGISYLAGFVYNKARDDEADSAFIGAGVLLFLGCMAQLCLYFSIHGRDGFSAIAIVTGLLVTIVVSIIVIRAGYGNNI